jgi:hypothetical protein
MPYYEYRCETNGQTLEVRHGMQERLETWGELARRAGADLGETPPETPVERLMSVPSRPATAGGPSFQGWRGLCLRAGSLAVPWPSASRSDLAWRRRSRASRRPSSTL